MSLDLVFFDIETGGLELHHPITQLAAVAYRDWREVDHCNVLLEFDEAAADPKALELNRYDRERWGREAVPLEAGLRRFVAWLEPHRTMTLTSQRTGNPYNVARLCGYNAASFDGPRLKAAFASVCPPKGLFLPADLRIPDTLQLALWRHIRMGEQLPSYRLGDVCRRWGVELQEAHDALSDVRATAQLTRRLLNGAAHA